MTRSPFPGMDPYLERHWLDVHTKLVTYAADDLNDHLPENLIARSEERIAVEDDEGDERLFGPDVRVFEMAAGPADIAEESGGAAVATPYRLLAQVEPITERFIRIIAADNERLVTIIEFVSPTNKRGEGLQDFKAKRGELLASGVNFVEIDLVRSGNWQRLLRPHRCPRKALSPYRVTVRVRNEPGAVYLYPIHLRDSLPQIIIPLRHDDPEVQLNLQILLDRAYIKGRYGRTLDYTQPPEPSLNEEEAAWADDLLKAADRR